ncbi:related to PET127 [Cephalotrichum gorgonifer]|uniref:Related to PET127 n=1 Tax=Cephalotrichum gorgonifer TaxID=2041049 RepID=A0AAE8SRW3_9PEZI|nr:related to PET127 [Cephalotrichum gorgonifer]
MLRLRCARRKLPLLRAAAGDLRACACNLTLPYPRSGRIPRAATAVASQRRWFSESSSYHAGKNSKTKQAGGLELRDSEDFEPTLAQASTSEVMDADTTSKLEEYFNQATQETVASPAEPADAQASPPRSSSAKSHSAKRTKAARATQDLRQRLASDVKKETAKKGVAKKAKAGESEGGKPKPKQHSKHDPKQATHVKKATQPKKAAQPKKATGAKWVAGATGLAAGLKKGITTDTPAPKTRTRKAPDEGLKVHTVDAPDLELTPIPHPTLPVPRLSYNLDRCLFKPGVYPLQDPRTRVFNFDPYLASIMPINEFDFSAIKTFVSSSEDPTLIDLTAKLKKKYSGSTSSMTSMLSHFHYLLSSWRPINAAQMSKAFRPSSNTFTRILRAPAATYLRRRSGIYAVDADKQFDSSSILSMLGKSMEKLLTLPKEEYELFRRSKSDQLTEEQRNAEEGFHYTTMGDFILRSQLDAHDPRLPGEGMFDLKTRAVLSIRMDVKDYHKGTDYEIRTNFGEFESFEREYYDMIRAAFLKYSLQVRMGRMDGIFVAFHNTRRIFGFQYIPLEEMDLALHGTTDTRLGDQEFKLSLHLLNDLMDRATKRFPDQPLRIHVETRPTNPPKLFFFAKPVTEENIQEAQKMPRSEVERLEKELMGLAEKEAAAEEAVQEEADVPYSDEDEPRYSSALAFTMWEEIKMKVEEAAESDELGAGYVRASVEEALKEMGLLEDKTAEEARAHVDELLEVLADGEDGEFEAEVMAGGEGGDLETLTAGESEAPGETSKLSEESRGVEDKISETEPVESRDGREVSSLKDLFNRLTGRASAEQDPDSVEAESAKAQDGIEAAKSQDSVEESTESQDGMESAEPEDGQEASTSLKDLIVRLAEQAGVGRAADDMGVADEKPLGLQRFEEVLSELAAESAVGDQDANAAAESGGPREVVEGDEDVLGLVLRARNKVDGQYVARPGALKEGSKWTVEYTVQTLDADRAAKTYSAIKKRRRAELFQEEDKSDLWHSLFGSALPRATRRGREYRLKESRESMGKPVYIVGEKEGKKWEDVFGKST